MKARVNVIADTSVNVMVCRDFVAALLAQDFERLRGCLADEFEFRALIEPGFHDIRSADETVALFRRWFGEALELHAHDVSVRALGERTTAHYAIDARDAEGRSSIEQMLCCDVAGGKIARLDLLCSGFH